MDATSGRQIGCRARTAIVAWAAVGLLAACGDGNGDCPPPGVVLGRYPAQGRADVDCPELRYAVWVNGPDPYTLDADDDRIGCERYLGRPIPDSARFRCSAVSWDARRLPRGMTLDDLAILNGVQADAVVPVGTRLRLPR